MRLPHALQVSDETPHSETHEGNGSLLIEWHRLDASRRIIRSLAIGATIMTFGACAAGFAIHAGWVERPIGRGERARAHVHELHESTDARSSRALRELSVSLAVLACLVGGGLTALIGLMRVLGEERYLALREDGALLVIDDTERFVSWDDLEAVRWDAKRDAVLLVPYGGDAVPVIERFADIANSELAKRAENIRRRAQFGLFGSAGPSASDKTA